MQGIRLCLVSALIAVAFATLAPGSQAAAVTEECAVVTPHTTYDYEVYDSDFGYAGAMVWRLYMATFLRQPEEAGMDYWRDQVLWQGADINNVASVFVGDREFQNRYGDLNNGAFVDLVYQNVLCRNPDASGRRYWVDLLNKGTVDRAGMMLYFAEGKEYLRRTNTCFSAFSDLNQQLPRCKTYKTCDDMRAAGYSDIWRGDVLFSVNLDTNKDFVACEDEWDLVFADDLKSGMIVSVGERDARSLKAVVSVSKVGTFDYRVKLSDSSERIYKSYDAFFQWSTGDTA